MIAFFNVLLTADASKGANLCCFIIMAHPLQCALFNNEKNVDQHMPFITIIGVIKVEHLWAKRNVGLAGFFMDYCSLGV